MSEYTSPTSFVAQPEDAEDTLRPRRLRDFEGQDAIRDALEIAVEAALGRQEALDHVLLHGPPGLGKTTLASLIADEMGTTLHKTSAPVLEKPGDLARLLSQLQPGDVLFIDEIHRLKPQLEEFLYPAMEDLRLDLRLGDGPEAEIVSLPLEPFTLVGATTRQGMLTAPMRARFGHAHRLDLYDPPVLTRIVRRSARILGVSCDEAGATEIAKRSRGTPRIANRLLRRVRDYAEVRAEGMIDQETADRALQLLKIDSEGLDEMDTRLLETLVRDFGGGPVGLSTLAAALDEDISTLEDVHEPFLIRNGFLTRTPRGRTATPKAWTHLGASLGL